MLMLSDRLEDMDIQLKKECEEVLKSIGMKDMVAIRFSIMMDIIRLCKKKID